MVRTKGEVRTKGGVRIKAEVRMRGKDHARQAALDLVSEILLAEATEACRRGRLARRGLLRLWLLRWGRRSRVRRVGLERALVEFGQSGSFE